MRFSIPSSTSNLGQGKLNTPDFALVAEAIFANNFQFGVTSEGIMLGYLTQRHKQRQATAQWPEDTNRRADSYATQKENTVVSILIYLQG